MIDSSDAGSAEFEAAFGILTRNGMTASWDFLGEDWPVTRGQISASIVARYSNQMLQ